VPAEIGETSLAEIVAAAVADALNAGSPANPIRVATTSRTSRRITGASKHPFPRAAAPGFRL
jgi:hypothetical protein